LSSTFRSGFPSGAFRRRSSPMDRLPGPVVAFLLLSLVVVACGNSDATPQPTAPAAAYGAAPPGYPPPQGAPTYYPPGYVAAPQYPAPTAAPYAQPAPAPVAPYPAAPVATYAPPAPAPAPVPAAPPAPAGPPAPAPAGPPAPAPTPTATMATPGLLALPCQSDAICGLHHCNTQYGKCAFPCQTGVDCVSNNCVMGVCMPGGGS
jgi:hypothetical protein